ncbi:RepB family plasmid replication initiator protein, partial [Desulfurella sp.]|uniref:RepB family plasmid replication initiator protein n=1 Tax=Desulfurella sp. TaxID=1962857 RepID=UPI003D0CDC20
MLLEFEQNKKALILKKPSGTIALAGNLDLVQRKFYDVLLHHEKTQLEKDNTAYWFSVPLSALKDVLNENDKNKINKEEKKQDVDKNNSYYKKILKKMQHITVEYNMLKKDSIVDGSSTLLSDVKFITNTQTKETVMHYNLSSFIKDALLNIIKGNPDTMYANINLVIVKGLKSKYSLILYELCKDYEKVEVPEMTIEQFKKIFGLENKKAYNFSNGFTNIRNKVLEPAINEINNNQNIDFMVEYKLKKQGNSYTHIKFITQTKPKQKQFEQYKEFSQVNILLNSVPEEHRTKAIERYLSKCLKSYDANYLLHQIEYTAQQKTKNFFAYLKKAIEEDYANDEKANLEEKKEAIKNKYQEQVKRIKKLRKEKGKVKLRKDDQGNVFYFDDI